MTVGKRIHIYVINKHYTGCLIPRCILLNSIFNFNTRPVYLPPTSFTVGMAFGKVVGSVRSFGKPGLSSNHEIVSHIATGSLLCFFGKRQTSFHLVLFV